MTRLTGAEGAVAVAGRDEQDAVPVDVDRWADLAARVLADEGVAGELGLVFTGEAEMARLNAEHLGGDGPTDVLAFPIDGRAATEGALVGDVVICPLVARRNAAGGGTEEDELALLVVHGVLHVLGMDHAEDADRAEMQAAERRHLDRFST